ncbi:MAG: hypothetical protein FWC36_02485 [Spirochaetes bacterium]|nr:hypothetical protein [Spirochaetota bacterium]
MINKRNWTGILAVILIFGFSGIAYAQSQEGTFTLTDIPPKFNGYYVFLGAENRRVELFGALSIDWAAETATLPRIVNGRVSIPMWILIDDGRTEELMRYNGNHCVELEIVILNSAILNDDSEEIAYIFFDSVRFSDGSATMSFYDNDEFEVF